MNTSLSMRRLALAALVALALPAAHAQDADRPGREAFAERHLERVQAHLDLSDQQAALVEGALAKRAPGALWEAAAALAPTLTAEQRDRLATPPERPDRMRPDEMRPDRPHRAPDADRPARRDRREERRARPDRPDRAADFEAMKAARDAALGLTADQAEALDALEAQRREAWQERREAREERGEALRDRRPAPGELPAPLAEILNDEQETIWRLHHALMPRFHGGPGGPPLGR